MKIKKYCRKLLSSVVALLLVMQLGALLLPENIVTAVTEKTVSASDNNYSDYFAYRELSKDISPATNILTLSPLNAKQNGSDAVLKQLDGIGEVIFWESGKGALDFTVDIADNALYALKLSYRPTDENVSEIDLGIKLDGKYPFKAFERVTFPSIWNNESNDFAADVYGNEMAPSQIMAEGVAVRYAQDKTGIVTDPYVIYLEAGNHTLTLEGKGDGIYLAEVKLMPAGNIKTYDEIPKKENGSNLKSKPIVLQGETSINKTSRSLLPMADTLDAGVYPSDTKVSLLNYVGGSNWQYVGDAITWQFEVENSGYYDIGFMYKQSVNMNRTSYRKLMIDGEVPFKEASSIPFKYSTAWHFKAFASDEGNNYSIWLENGKHEITIEATLGEKDAEFCRRLGELADSLNAIYLEIIKITGATPDLNRDYELFKQIPNFNEMLEQNSRELGELIKDMEMESDSGSSEVAASLKNMVRVLDKMISRPYRAHDYINSYFSAYSSISSWLFDMKKMPLAIDEIQIVAKGSDFLENDSGFFKNIIYRTGRFFYSFLNDYNSFSPDTVDGKSITLWVMWGKDQASALDVMIKNSFTPKTGINVNLKIVGATLVNGIISGQYPDLLLSQSRTEPVNLGMRGALYDLKQFKDYEDVLTRFQKGAEIPYLYRDACYALPDTQQFFCMFYRKDILENLGVDVPKTWSDFIKTAAVIQRNNMEIYIPYTQIATNAIVNQGIGILNLYPTLMQQSGLSLYNEKRTATSLNTADAINVFEYWTKMYTDYKFVKESDFYNRFRMGLMPLGIAPYGTYFSIEEMAPEVQGKWSIALVPGMTEQNNIVAGGGSGCAIVQKSDKKEYAWEFLKWWTSADTQFEYSNRVESILGLVGRITTSNVEALNRMEWDKDQLKILNEQWKRVNEIEEVPGSYYVIRAVDQAYWSVINDEMNAMDALSYWSDSADDEIERKCREYGYLKED